MRTRSAFSNRRDTQVNQNEKIMVAAAAVVAIVAVIAFVVIRGGGMSTTVPDAGQTQGPTSGPGGMGSATSAPTGKLVMIPKGTTPAAHLKKVYALVKAKKYKEAFKMYPDNVQQGGLQAFTSSREIMPVVDFKVGAQTTKGNTATIPVTQTLGGQAQGSKWVVTWHFKEEKGQWGVESYEVNMAQ